jgi:hypothetical protein
MIGKIFITSSGYDPQLGKHVKDPYLGPSPTLGACRPDIREQLHQGDHIFVISGKIPDANQFVMGGFEIAEKITASEAYLRFPELRLRKRDDGQVTGNVIVNADGKQHDLDHHESFERRIQNFIVGKSPIVLSTPPEIIEGRRQTLRILQDVFQKTGSTPRDIIGRCSKLTEKQIEKLRVHLDALKRSLRPLRPVRLARGLTEVARRVC